MNLAVAKRTVSVLIPTYKYRRFLRETIESVLNQSLTDFELIISDDDSQDGSAEIIREFASRDDRIRFKLQSPNLGMVQNWNWCLNQAQGRYVKYVFGDDFLTSRDALAELVRLMEMQPGIRLAACARVIVDEHSAPTAIWSHVEKPGITPGSEMISLCLQQDRNLIGEPSVVLFRKEDAGSGFDASFRQVVDLEFWIRLLRGGSLAYTKEPLCAFRRHPEQQTVINSRTIDCAREHVRLLRMYADYLVLSPEYGYEVFRRLYRLRKQHELKPYESELAEALSTALGTTYLLHWLRYKATRPFSKLRRAWNKHVTGTHAAATLGADTSRDETQNLS